MELDEINNKKQVEVSSIQSSTFFESETLKNLQQLRERERDNQYKVQKRVQKSMDHLKKANKLFLPKLDPNKDLNSKDLKVQYLQKV